MPDRKVMTPEQAGHIRHHFDHQGGTVAERVVELADSHEVLRAERDNWHGAALIFQDKITTLVEERDAALAQVKALREALEASEALVTLLFRNDAAQIEDAGRTRRAANVANERARQALAAAPVEEPR